MTPLYGRRGTDCRRDLGPGFVRWDMPRIFRAEQARRDYHMQPRGSDVLAALIGFATAIALTLWLR